MEAVDGREIRKAHGKSPCNYPVIEKETINGAETGNRICINCGGVFYPDLFRLLKALLRWKYR